MEAEFKLCSVIVFYDVHYDLEDNKKGDATFRVKYDSVDFDLNIVREHNAEVKSTLIYRGINSGGRGLWGTAVTTHPNTPQVQLITNTLHSKQLPVPRSIDENFGPMESPTGYVLERGHKKG
ncbi:uncharacterized protein LOC129577229 [Sitodiplosis mosellana]|uniref:uncharacterized protein LOC129577229 n=1 Tax=Sitodiplosis mosellana TaxID=263140 RepID=UPI00244525ED|nr:uncharacterized protein LOC129577229 [Sitodiplosis mosellana]